ncbi:MAG: hypothetical protein IJW73_02070, partial [Candidatus Gastranaerophilales bacterium]|nr:hypothetical protein [Candidatus Gastranaerophilales bacterium]
IEQGKTPEEVAKILKEAKIDQGVEYEVATMELGFDSEREEEIYTSFNNVFNNAGLEDSVVDALADLCVQQQNDRSYMLDKSGDELAQAALKKYQK